MRIRLSGNALIGWLVAIVVLVLALFSRRSSFEGFQACPPTQYSTCLPKKGDNENCANGNECKTGFCKNNKCSKKVSKGGDCANAADCISNNCVSGKCAAIPTGSQLPMGYTVTECASGTAQSTRPGPGQMPVTYCGCTEPNKYSLDLNNIGRGCKLNNGQKCNSAADCVLNSCERPGRGAKDKLCMYAPLT